MSDEITSRLPTISANARECFAGEVLHIEVNFGKDRLTIARAFTAEDLNEALVVRQGVATALRELADGLAKPFVRSSSGKPPVPPGDDRRIWR